MSISIQVIYIQLDITVKHNSESNISDDSLQCRQYEAALVKQWLVAHQILEVHFLHCSKVLRDNYFAHETVFLHVP